RAELGIEHALVAVLHVVGHELTPVVEPHALAQLEHPRLAVRARGPGLSERGIELAVGAPFHESVVEEGVEAMAGERLLEVRLEAPRLPALAPDQSAARAR